MAGGTKTVSTSGGNTTQTNVTEIPAELKPLYSYNAWALQDLQQRFPLFGGTGYQWYMPNPDWQPGEEAWVYDPESAFDIPNFLGENPAQIAPMSAYEQRAMDLAPGMENKPLSTLQAESYASQAPGLAARTPTAAPYYQNFGTSPFYTAAWDAYQQDALPMIQNQMALAGLGRSSTAGDAMAKGWATQMPELLGQYATNYVEPEMGRIERGYTREAETMAGLVPQLSTMGVQDLARQKQAMDAYTTLGSNERAIQQAQYDAQYQDFLRRQALAEQALFTPAGMIIPSAIAGNTRSTGTTSGGKTTSSGGGGLFK